MALACRHLHIIKPHLLFEKCMGTPGLRWFWLPKCKFVIKYVRQKSTNFHLFRQNPLPASPYACLCTNLRTSASAHWTSHSVSWSSGDYATSLWKATLLANKTRWHAAENLPFLITLAFLFRLAALMVKEARFGSCVDIRSRSYVTSCSPEKLRWPRLSIETVLLSLEVE